jgi:hypothetical protein
MFSSKMLSERVKQSPAYMGRMTALQQAGAIPTPPAAQAATPAPAVQDNARRAVEGDLHTNEPMAILQRNQPNAGPGPYVTQLSPTLEASYRQWVQGAGIPTNPDHPTPDYDTRGLWRDHGWQAATQMYQRPDYQRKLPETYRTPYHRQFTPASQYAAQNAAISPNMQA